MFKTVFIRVYLLPSKLTNGYCFGGGNPITFQNVDWMETDEAMPREELIGFIKGKRYYSADAEYLVLGDHPDFTFRIMKEGGANVRSEG